MHGRGAPSGDVEPLAREAALSRGAERPDAREPGGEGVGDDDELLVQLPLRHLEDLVVAVQPAHIAVMSAAPDALAELGLVPALGPQGAEERHQQHRPCGSRSRRSVFSRQNSRSESTGSQHSPAAARRSWWARYFS